MESKLFFLLNPLVFSLFLVPRVLYSSAHRDFWILLLRKKIRSREIDTNLDTRALGNNNNNNK